MKTFYEWWLEQMGVSWECDVASRHSMGLSTLTLKVFCECVIPAKRSRIANGDMEV